jgi:hypothetical protein
MEKVEKPAEQAPAVQDAEQIADDEPAGIENLIAEAARLDAEAEKIRKRMEKYGFREQNDPEYIDLNKQLDDLVTRRLLLRDQMYRVQNPQPEVSTPTPTIEEPKIEGVPDKPKPDLIDIKEIKKRMSGLGKYLVEIDINPLAQYTDFDKIKNLRKPGITRALEELDEYFRTEGNIEALIEVRKLMAGDNNRGIRIIDNPDFYNAIDKIQNFIDGPLKNKRDELYDRIDASRGDWDARRLLRADLRQVNKLISDLVDMGVNPDPYSSEFRRYYRSVTDRIDTYKELLGEDVVADARRILDSISLPELPVPAPKNLNGKSDKAAIRLRELAPELSGIVTQDGGITGDVYAVGGFNGWKASNISGGANPDVYRLTNINTGETVVIKRERLVGPQAIHRGGSKPEVGAQADEMTTTLYRALGLPTPASYVLNRDEDGERGTWFLMQDLDSGMPEFGIDDYSIAGYYDGRIKINDKFQEETLHMVVANAVIGNTDRHQGNFLVIELDDGTHRLALWDNGITFFNGGQGEIEKYMPNVLHFTPVDALRGVEGNKNYIRKYVRKYYKELRQQYGEEEARKMFKDSIQQFGEKMRERAAVIDFIDDRSPDFLNQRIDWILNNLDKFLDRGIEVDK